MSKLGKQITKGTLDSKIKEKHIVRTIKKIQKSEKNLLREVRSLLENKVNEEEIVPICKNILDSRKLIQKLKRFQYYVKSIQSFYRRAQLSLLHGESMEQVGKTLVVLNRVLSPESLEESILGMETELEELDINIEQVNSILEDYTDPLVDEDSYINNIIETLKNAKSEEVETTISEIVSIDNLLPNVPDDIFKVEEKERDSLES